MSWASTFYIVNANLDDYGSIFRNLSGTASGVIYTSNSLVTFTNSVFQNNVGFFSGVMNVDTYAELIGTNLTFIDNIAHKGS